MKARFDGTGKVMVCWTSLLSQTLQVKTLPLGLACLLPLLTTPIQPLSASWLACCLIHDLLNYSSFNYLSPPPEAYLAPTGCLIFYSQHEASTNSLDEKKGEWEERERGKEGEQRLYLSCIAPFRHSEVPVNRDFVSVWMPRLEALPFSALHFPTLV